MNNTLSKQIKKPVPKKPKPQPPKPKVELDVMKAIPRTILQERFKVVAKAKTDLMKERSKIVAEANKETDKIVQEALKKANLDEEYNKHVQKINNKVAELTQKIVEYEGSMKMLMELINMKKGG